ncbi:histidine kinase dimerization/phosphoacceptor domain-containing protein [Streptomyces sp. NPDC088810]|uniref:histidine kinase dimerization/phosphoacceptor domain-containing protein n=1 Tax=Streptomyces sp. NPDC088810 TaxID=3365904 RepID=UPI003822951E
MPALCLWWERPLPLGSGARRTAGLYARRRHGGDTQLASAPAAAAGQGALLWPGVGTAGTPGGPALFCALSALALETAAPGRRRPVPVRALACTLGALVLGGLAWPRPALLSDMAIALGVYLLCAGSGRHGASGSPAGSPRPGGWPGRSKPAGRRPAADHERRRLARELHDVSPHHLTPVVVTADAARRLHDSRPDLAAEALSFAERTGAETSRLCNGWWPARRPR